MYKDVSVGGDLLLIPAGCIPFLSVQDLHANILINDE